MLRKVLILLALLFYCTTALPQEENEEVKIVRQHIIQLREQIDKASSDTERINLFLQLSNNYININDDSAFLLLDQSEAYANRIKYNSGFIKSIQLKGAFYETQHKNYPLALSYYKKAMSFAKTKNSYALVQELYTNHLNLYFYNGEFINAMKTASEGLAVAEQHKDEARITQFYNIIGFIHLRQNNAVEAEIYYNLFLLHARKFSDSTTVGDALICLGETMLLKKDCASALSFFRQAEDVLSFLSEKRRLLKKDRMPYILFKKANAYDCSGDIRTALHYSNKALAESKRTACNLYDIAQYYIFTGNLYSQANQFEKAAMMLHSGLNISRKINHKENTRDAFLYLHQLFAKEEKYDSAYYFYSLYDALKDSIVNENTRKEIDQIDANYQIEKKNNEIKLLSQQKKLQEQQIKQQTLLRNLVVIFAILVIVTFLFITNRNHLKRKNKLQRDINEKQAELFNITASIQDNERKRIAQDLHDGMGTLLSAAKLRLSSIHRTEQVSDTLQLIDEATIELRDISHNLMPATLSKLGLIAALQNMIERLNSENIRINLITHGIDERLQEEMEIFTYRIISELMNNVVKHSKAAEASIQVIKYPNKINITVEDNGKGFHLQNENEGIGLTNIRSRVEYLKGNMYIDSGVGKGTTVVIDIPC